VKRLLLAATCTLLLVVGLSPAASAGGQAGFNCSPGFDIGAVTFEDGIELPRIQAGLAAGVYTIEDLATTFQGIDHNGNGLICLKDVGALNGGVAFWAFFYGAVDDNAAVASP
jgi:hypothetical protein